MGSRPYSSPDIYPRLGIHFRRILVHVRGVLRARCGIGICLIVFVVRGWGGVVVVGGNSGAGVRLLVSCCGAFDGEKIGSIKTQRTKMDGNGDLCRACNSHLLKP